jgi:hypothetical protein
MGIQDAIGRGVDAAKRDVVEAVENVKDKAKEGKVRGCRSGWCKQRPG